MEGVADWHARLFIRHDVLGFRVFGDYTYHPERPRSPTTRESRGIGEGTFVKSRGADRAQVCRCAGWEGAHRLPGDGGRGRVTTREQRAELGRGEDAEVDQPIHVARRDSRSLGQCIAGESTHDRMVVV